jgi:exodeoxyribonuclease-3
MDLPRRPRRLHGLLHRAMARQAGHIGKPWPNNFYFIVPTVVRYCLIMRGMQVGIVAHLHAAARERRCQALLQLLWRQRGGGVKGWHMPASFKVATWNVNSLRLRLPQVLTWLAEHQPTALLLQETKVEDALFPLADLHAAGWQAVYHGQKSYNGVAILARTLPTSLQLGFTTHPAATEGQARVIAATVQGVRLLNLYLPQGEATDSPKFAFKERCYAALQAELTTLAQHYPALVASGDYNIAAEARDIPIPPAKAEQQVMFTPAEQAWFGQLQQASGLRDALRLVNQEAGIYSWYDYRTYARAPQHGWRIDYHLVSPTLQPRVRHVVHHTAVRALPQPSDHVPVVLHLDL